MKRKYQFFSDAGHGWLRVPIDELNTARAIIKAQGEVAKFPSEYSYISFRGEFAYLEEDVDMAKFFGAMKIITDGQTTEDRMQWWAEHVTDVDMTDEDYCFIRSYDRF